MLNDLENSLNIGWILLTLLTFVHAMKKSTKVVSFVHEWKTDKSCQNVIQNFKQNSQYWAKVFSCLHFWLQWNFYFVSFHLWNKYIASIENCNYLKQSNQLMSFLKTSSTSISNIDPPPNRLVSLCLPNIIKTLSRTKWIDFWSHFGIYMNYTTI